MASLDLPARPPAVDARPAWRVAAASSGVTAAVLGLAGANGVVVAALADDPAIGLRPVTMLAALALVLQFGLGPLAGAIAERRGPEGVVAGGGLLLAVGALTAGALGVSVAGFAAWSIGLGLSAACVTTPTLAAMAGWFDRHRAAAFGGIAAANAMGVLVAAPVLDRALVRHGPAGAWRVTGVTAGLVAAGIGTLVRRGPMVAPGPRLRAAVVAALASPALRRFYIAGVLGSAGALATSTLLPTYATEVGWSPSEAALVVSLAAVTGVGGRLLVPVLTRRQPPLAVYRACLVAMACVLVSWPIASRHPVVLVALAVGYGVSVGGWAALTPVVLAAARPDGLASLLGLVFTAPALGGSLGLGLAAAANAATGSLAPVGAVATLLVLGAARLLRPIPVGSTGGPSRA